MIIIRKALMYLIAVTLCICAAFSPLYSVSATAANEEIKFDDINVLDDLQSSTADGKAFDFSKYPRNPYGTASAITFVEYCYSYYGNGMSNYGLYIYIYNPALLNLSESIGLNKIQIANSFNAEGYPNSYSKYQLMFCNKSGGDYYKLFYKYKVIDTGNKLLGVVEDYAKKHNGIRRYHVSGAELLTIGDYTAADCEIGTTFEFTGFAEGYGPSDNFPLTSKVYALETLELNVHSTYYRPKGENVSGTHVQDQLNSVYFAVPNDMLKKYGALYAVHVEWWEYLTKEVFMLGNKTVYDKLINYIGQYVEPYDKNAYYGFLVNPYRSSMVGNPITGADMIYNAYSYSVYCYNVLNKLYYLFDTSNTAAKDYMLPSEKFQEYIRNYSDMHGNKTICGKYSGDLFYAAADAGRKAGYNEVTIQADDGYGLTSYVLEEQSFWNQLFGIKTYSKTAYDGIKGIYEVSAADFASNNKSTICNKLYIAESDYDEFKKFYDSSTAKEEKETVFLLRFAVTDYVSKPVESTYYSFGLLGTPYLEIVDKNAYMGQQTAFLNFDIIDVTFYKDGVSTVIPVVSSPIDIFNDFTPPVNIPEDGLSLWQIILMILALIVFLFVLWPILPSIITFIFTAVRWVFKSVVWIVTAPFKAIKKMTTKKGS